MDYGLLISRMGNLHWTGLKPKNKNILASTDKLAKVQYTVYKITTTLGHQDIFNGISSIEAYSFSHIIINDFK